MLLFGLLRLYVGGLILVKVIKKLDIGLDKVMISSKEKFDELITNIINK